MKKASVRFISPILIMFLFITAAAYTIENNFDPTSYEGLRNILLSDEEVLLVDVRTAEEYASGHIPGAVNIPYDVILENMPKWDKDKPIVLYCRSGRRAGAALETLTEVGYTRLYNFGGISKWEGELET